MNQRLKKKKIFFLKFFFFTLFFFKTFFKSFKNLSRDANFRIVEQVQDQSFFDLIEPIFAIGDFKNYAVVDTDDAIEKEKERLKKFKYEFFSLNAGTSMYKGSGVSLKKTSGTTQRQGTAYRIYGCGMLGNVNKPQILIPLETLVVLSHPQVANKALAQ